MPTLCLVSKFDLINIQYHVSQNIRTPNSTTPVFSSLSCRVKKNSKNEADYLDLDHSVLLCRARPSFGFQKSHTIP